MGGGGRGRPRGIWHFHGNQSQIPHPQAPTECQFPTPGVTFSIRCQDLIIDRLERICLFQPHIVFTAFQERQCQKMSSSAGHNNGGQDVLTQTWWYYMSHVSYYIHRTCSWALSRSSNRAKKTCIIISFWMQSSIMKNIHEYENMHKK